MLCCIMLSERGELLEVAQRWFEIDMSKYFLLKYLNLYLGRIQELIWLVLL